MKVRRLYTYWGPVLLMLIFAPVIIKGQKKESVSFDKRTYNKALNLIEKGDYHSAIHKLSALLKADSTNLDVLYYLGYCYLNTSDVPDTAAYYFQKGLNYIPESEKYNEAGLDFRLALAETQQVLLKPDKALALYEEIKGHIPKTDKDLAEFIDHKIVVCRNAMIYLNNSVEILVKNLGPNVNSKYDDHSPMISVKNSQLIFTSRRPTPNSVRLKDGQYPEKIFYTKKVDGEWTKAKLLQMFYKKFDHESAASVSADGSELYIFHNDNEGKSIYVSYFNGKDWEKPVKLPYPINSPADETHASLSADKSTLFFTSNREGGLGGMDIYMTKRGVNGKWGPPKNLGPNINTEFDEDTPFLHPDGKTLYFSSEGHNSMGRMDVFYSVMDADSSWTEPINMGFPINTPDDDFFFVPTISKSEAYYASSRFEDNYGGADIYNVKFKENSTGNLAVIEGVIKKSGDTPVEKIRILVTDLDHNRLVGDYRPDPKTGTYLMFLETGNLYEVKQVMGGKEMKVEHIDIPEEMKVELLDVPEEKAYDETNEIVLFKEVTITPPLTPILARLETDAKDIEKQIKMITARQVKRPVSAAKSEQAVSEDSVKHYRYALQILALRKKPLYVYLYFRDLNSGKIRSYKCTDGYTRYIYGVYDGFKAAKKVMLEIQESGKFQDAFIRDYSDIERLAYPGEKGIYNEYLPKKTE
jgi:tetratricopeptide (TPR) repeat protein